MLVIRHHPWGGHGCGCGGHSHDHGMCYKMIMIYRCIDLLVWITCSVMIVTEAVEVVVEVVVEVAAEVVVEDIILPSSRCI